MLLTLSGRGRLSHPPNRSMIQSKKTPDLYTEEEEEKSDVYNKKKIQMFVVNMTFI